MTDGISLNPLGPEVNPPRLEKRLVGAGSGPLTALFAVAIIEVVNEENNEYLRYVNNLLCKLSGYAHDELLNASLDLLIPERSQKAHHHYSRGYLARPEPRPMGPDREVVLLQKNGQEVRVWVGLAPHDETHVTAAILPMDIGRSFGLPVDRLK